MQVRCADRGHLCGTRADVDVTMSWGRLTGSVARVSTGDWIRVWRREARRLDCGSGQQQCGPWDQWTEGA